MPVPVIPIDQLLVPITEDEVMAFMLGTASALGLDVSSWQPGQPGRTILRTIAAAIVSAGPGNVTRVIAAGGFLDTAAATDITPEGGPGWLDLLGTSLYRVTRIPATRAATSVVITCTNASGGPIAARQMHFLNTTTGKTYANVNAFTLPSNGTVTGLLVEADETGAASSAGAGAIDALATPLIGVVVTNPTAAVGNDAEKNAAYADRCRLRLAALSVSGPRGAYDYNARTINGDNQVQVASGALTQPVQPVTKTNVVTDPLTGFVTVYVASASGAYATPPNYTEQVEQSIVSSTNATPIVVEVTGHGYVSTDQVFIKDHLVNTAANGSWTITVLDADHFELDGSTGNGVGGATGTAYRYSDLDLIGQSIQANAEPLCVTETTESAVDLPVPVVGVITVTGATSALSDAQIASNASTQLALLAQLLPIGGLGTSGKVYLEMIRRTVFDANAGTINVTLSSPAADVTVAVNENVSFPTPVFTVVRQ